MKLILVLVAACAVFCSAEESEEVDKALLIEFLDWIWDNEKIVEEGCGLDEDDKVIVADNLPAVRDCVASLEDDATFEDFKSCVLNGAAEEESGSAEDESGSQEGFLDCALALFAEDDGEEA